MFWIRSTNTSSLTQCQFQWEESWWRNWQRWEFLFQFSSRTSRFGLRDQMQVDISWKILTLARPSTQADIICEKTLLWKTIIWLLSIHLVRFLNPLAFGSQTLSTFTRAISFCPKLATLFVQGCSIPPVQRDFRSRLNFLEPKIWFLKEKDYEAACFWLSSGGWLLLQVTKTDFGWIMISDLWQCDI